MSFLNLKSKILLIFSSTLLLAACGPGMPVLPDDPDNEPVAESSGENNGAQSLIELPSISEDPEVAVPAPSVDERGEVLKLYSYLDPQRIVPTEALETAVLYYHEKKATLKNSSVLSLIDFSQRSSKKRWYFIDMKTGSVWNVHVSHGKGSDSNHDGYAEKFSNVEGSNASSLGFYKTAETYSGKHGYSLRLDGLSSTNYNARSRAIVVHGASYVQDSSVVQGRSWGCPAISMDNRDKVINLIKGGSLIYAFK